VSLLRPQLRHTATFAVAGGKVTERHPPSKAEYAADNYRDMLSSISSRLPDMRFVINLLDEPRVLLGPGSVDDRCGGMVHTCKARSVHSDGAVRGH